jgi:Zn finger protein HypA/HybF involved in hydrogenase expression
MAIKTTAFDKTIECDDCGAVTRIPKWMTLKLSWCKECQSQKIRLYKGNPNDAYIPKTTTA